MTTISELPMKHFAMPTVGQVRNLREIVIAAHPWLRDGPGEDGEAMRAFWAAGTFYRRVQPSSLHYFSFYLDAANRRLEDVNLAPISGNALLIACIAWGDIPWQRPDRFVGALLELGLDEWSGRRANDVWKDVLTGERGLLPPVLRDRGIKRQEGVHVVHGAEPYAY